MPPFSEPAKDLISQLLTLDPSKRITIQQIKQHPFFRMNLPEDYVTPTPIPFPNFIEPIDPNTVSPDIIDILRKIGYNDDAELAMDFASPTHSMAKVFYHMLTTRVSFDQLDWSLSVDANAQRPVEEQIILNPSNQAYTVSGNDPFHRDSKSFSPQSYDAGNSLADRPDWNMPESQQTKDIIQTYEIKINGIAITELMRLVQITVRNLGMQWFFPDDFTILAKIDQNGGYVIFQSSSLHTEVDTMLTLQLFQGSSEAFSTVCKSIEDIIAGNKASS